MRWCNSPAVRRPHRPCVTARLSKISIVWRYQDLLDHLIQLKTVCRWEGGLGVERRELQPAPKARRGTDARQCRRETVRRLDDPREAPFGVAGGAVPGTVATRRTRRRGVATRHALAWWWPPSPTAPPAGPAAYEPSARDGRPGHAAPSTAQRRRLPPGREGLRSRCAAFGSPCSANCPAVAPRTARSPRRERRANQMSQTL